MVAIVSECGIIKRPKDEFDKSKWTYSGAHRDPTILILPNRYMTPRVVSFDKRFQVKIKSERRRNDLAFNYLRIYQVRHINFGLILKLRKVRRRKEPKSMLYNLIILEDILHLNYSAIRKRHIIVAIFLDFGIYLRI